MGGAENYGSSDSGMLTFHTQNGYVVSAIPPERMRITSGGNLLVGTTTDNGNRLQVTGNGYFSGNVGIGTASPQVKLSVHGSQNNTIAPANGVAKFVGGDAGIFVGTLAGVPNYGSWIQAMRESDGLTFPLFLNPTGSNVLIGTTTDSGEKLQVNGTGRFSSSVTASVRLKGNSTTGLDLLNDSGGGYFWNRDNTPIYFATNNTQRLFISETGAATFSSSVTASSFIKSGGTSSQYLMADGSVTTGSALTITNRQTASDTLALTDADKLVEMNVATANNLTVPLNSSVAFAIGTKIDLAQYGAGQTTVVATSGVTVRSAGGALKLALQYSGASLVKIATDEWYLFGDITV